MPGPERGVPATIKITDVAAAAGVAPMTVSRVINTPDRVSPETTAKVKAAIEKLGYVPNLIAGGLSSRRSRMVAAIVPTIAHPMFAGLVQAFTDTMREAGYQVMLSLSGYRGADDEALFRAMLGRRPDAMLVTGASYSEAAWQLLLDAHIPVVEVWEARSRPVDMLVGFDHVDLGAAVASFFLSKGHTRFVTFSADDCRARARTRGFVDAARLAGGTIVATHTMLAPSTITAGRNALRALLPHLTERTALFCSSDQLAFGALTEARQQGIAVPDRLAVCGFGNFEVSSASEPPFTTVHVEGVESGRIAANLLLRRLSGEPRGDQDCVAVPFHVVERAST